MSTALLENDFQTIIEKTSKKKADHRVLARRHQPPVYRRKDGIPDMSSMRSEKTIRYEYAKNTRKFLLSTPREANGAVIIRR
jgi:hypothetical protein